MEWHLTRLDVVASTMDWAREAAKSGEPDFTAIIAKQQTQGRGRLHRVWESPAGNLYFSFLLRIPGEVCGLMSLSLAVALHEALRPLIPQNVPIELKWPNDVLVDGRKIAGILIEMEGGAAIIGIGVNIASAPEGKAAVSEWSDIDAESFLVLLKQEIMALYKEADPAAVVRRWNELAAYKGQEITFLQGVHTLHGVFEGVDESGHARIRSGHDIKGFASGEVTEVRSC